METDERKESISSPPPLLNPSMPLKLAKVVKAEILFFSFRVLVYVKLI